MSPDFRLTRLAPTPSGYLHIGNVFSFAVTAALASITGAAIRLRIDDMDRERVRPAYIADIFETLSYMGIAWDEGPVDVESFDSGFSQLHRMGLYQAALDQLAAEGKVYACSCSRSNAIRGVPCRCLEAGIPLDTPQTAWKLRTNAEAETAIQTLEGPVSVRLPVSMTDFIVRKRDGYPAYQLSSLIDDLHYGVDLIVRGQDLWPSTIAQHFLAAALGLEAFGSIHFHHHILLSDSQGEKLSKSAGSTSIKHLISEGFQPNQIYNLIGNLLRYTGETGGFMELGKLGLVKPFA